ncbi:acyl-CoA dehydrogenase [Mycobacterium saskatchewanense]|uniref:Oxidoreductase n=1 Tax=Mycobacterium saskatchewanense TaxID=220927 RepID=A0AAJ3TVS5_9MYCO|nr:acyl-CoA dehydrogenase family protein [Mycobacterium saskatchewanense]ORW72675.1 hypothetical protein AWC23_09505 [Mycobacterium saskatchewanense]BBX65970.1 acyl-CoA dehydrogenase [Mycobacterium saskatchewanense]
MIEESATADPVGVPVHQDLVSRAGELKPLLQAHATTGEINRRLDDRVISALTEAGMFRIHKPMRFGGYEATQRTLLAVTEILGQADASAAWVVTVNATAAWVVARGSQKLQSEIFGVNPDARLAGGSEPVPARMGQNGIYVSGRWGFASGCTHADWFSVTAATTDESGQTTGTYCLMPASEFTVEDTWHVVGMRGTASNTLVTRDLFVPKHRMIPLDALTENSPSADTALYRLPLGPIGASGLVGPLLGVGQAALDLVCSNAAGKPLHNTVFPRQSDSTGVQIQIAEAKMQLYSARLHAYDVADQLDTAAAQGRSVGYSARARMRAQCAHAVQLVLKALNTLLNVHGAASFAEANPMQRFWRDANTAARHAALNAVVGYEVYGKALLGIEERVAPMV